MSNTHLELGPKTCKTGSGERIEVGYVADILKRAIRRRRGFPRERLVWIPMERHAGNDCGPARIDTVDDKGAVLATEVLLERTTAGRAFIHALERGIDADIDGQVHRCA